MTASAPLLDRPRQAATYDHVQRRRNWLRPTVWTVAVLAVLALLAVVIGATAGGNSSSTSSTSAGKLGSAEQVSPTKPGGSSSDSSAGIAGSGSTGSTASGPAPAAGGAAAPAPPVVPPSVSAERVVKTGQVELVAAKGRVSTTLTAVQQAAEAQGGVLSGSSTLESGSTPSGSITVRVPVARFGALLLAVRGLGTGVHSAQSTSSDVTGQSVDLDAQDRTLRDTRDQLLDIKRKATTVTDILAVQQRIDDITSRINETDGQAAVLRDQAAMSTLAVTVREADDPAYGRQPEPKQGGLGQAFRDARHSFGRGVEAIVRASGGLLLFVLCLLALGSVVLLGRRFVQPRIPSTGTPAEPAQVDA